MDLSPIAQVSAGFSAETEVESCILPECEAQGDFSRISPVPTMSGGIAHGLSPWPLGEKRAIGHQEPKPAVSDKHSREIGLETTGKALLSPLPAVLPRKISMEESMNQMSERKDNFRRKFSFDPLLLSPPEDNLPVSHDKCDSTGTKLRALSKKVFLDPQDADDTPDAPFTGSSYPADTPIAVLDRRLHGNSRWLVVSSRSGQDSGGNSDSQAPRHSTVLQSDFSVLFGSKFYSGGH